MGVAAGRLPTEARGDTKMAIQPDELRNKTFPIVKRGYDKPEVHRYLQSIAEDLDAFNEEMAKRDEIVVAEVVDDRRGAGSAVTQFEAASVPSQYDDFDRVGSEISLMLRHAQESAAKIRTDAETDARTLVDQVRIDIEADRVAHEQAAAELISRTEQRALELRSEAEQYSTQARSDADSFAKQTREDAEFARGELTANAEAEKAQAETTLREAEEQAQATIDEANRQAEEIVANADAHAQAKADELLDQARETMRNMIGAEESSRENLELARTNIDNALEQIRITEYVERSN